MDDLRHIDPAAEGVGAEGTPGMDVAGDFHADGGEPGKKIAGGQPVYPEIARQQRVVGSVVLGGVISEKGKVVCLFPVASSSKYLSGSAMDAVKMWRYTPALLKGTPVAVTTTTITVNYALRGVPSPF